MNQGLFSPSFGSDNHSGVHPKVLESMGQYNLSHAPSYGTDSLSAEANRAFKELFHESCQSFFVFNGTAANVLSIKALIPEWKSVLCTDVSHLYVDECGAPEAIAGVKLQPVKSTDGKLKASDLEKYMIRGGDQHFASPGLLSITQPTELGTVYSFAEMRELRTFADKHGLKLHIDGARLANSLITLDCNFSDLYEVLKPDAISFGGTKNGLLGVEAVLLFDKQISQNFKFIRKQNMQLPSKTRFLAAQFLAYFQGDLYKEIARHSHEMAKRFAQEMAEIPQMVVLHPIESNAVFAKIPKAWTKPLRELSFFYIWDEQEWSIRLMASFDTDEKQITQFIDRAKLLSQESSL